MHRSAAARYRESPGSAPPSARPRCGLLESLYQLRSLRHLEAWFDKMVLDVAPDDTPVRIYPQCCFHPVLARAVGIQGARC